MISDKKFDRIASRIRNTGNTLVTAHIRADGDAIASICFVSGLLRSLGKPFLAVLDDATVDPRYSFLTCFDTIRSFDTHEGTFDAETAIVLDSPTLDRTGRVANLVTACPSILCIDHHPGNGDFATDALIDPSASSTCELLTGLLEPAGITPTPDMVTALYTGIAFDTGNFRFSNTRPSTLRAAAALVDAGADPESISDRLFSRWSMLRVRAMAQVLAGMELLDNRRIAVSMLPYAFFVSHPGAARELEGLSDLAVSIEGVCVAAFLREMQPGNYKISLRARGDWDVGSVAEQFAGGGHRKAAGCQINGDYRDVIAKLVDAIRRTNPCRRQNS